MLPTLEEFRIPIRFLASLFSAGKEQLIRTSLLRQLAVRSFRRSLRVDGTATEAVMESVGLTAQDARDMHRMLSLGHFHERYVIPTTRRERTANAPYIERGFSGFSELQPAESPKRRSFFQGGKQEVWS